jgi:hypothetical protein
MPGRPSTMNKAPAREHLQSDQPSTVSVAHQTVPPTIRGAFPNKPHPLRHGTLPESNGRGGLHPRRHIQENLAPPQHFPRAGLHAPSEDLGFNIPTVWEDYCKSAIRSWTQILHDEGALGVAARASYTQAAQKFKHWHVELAFHTHRGHAT